MDKDQLPSPQMPDITFAPPADIVDILAAECAACAAVATTLSEDDFGLPTRCPPWDVKALVGHIWRDVDRILVYAAEPAPDAADSDALAYYGADYDAVASAPDVTRRGFEAAAAFATGHELARDFDDRWRRAVELARSMPPDRRIRTFGPCLRLDQYLCTRLLEAAVHGLDLADAIEREPWITPRATALVRSMLVGMLGAEPPDALGWDDLAFLEVGTGRRAIALEERAVLGPLAERFPLLS
jgi:uncharacterized protein (TIGR03083 family)